MTTHKCISVKKTRCGNKLGGEKNYQVSSFWEYVDCKQCLKHRTNELRWGEHVSTR